MKGKAARSNASITLMLMLITMLLFSGAGAKVAEAQEVPYGQVFQRDYVSSIDGAPLTCSIYIPPKGVAQPMPVWVDLHAYGGPGGIRWDWMDWCNAQGMMLISPWGRNFKGLWMDGMEPAGTAKEPCIVDDFRTGASGWQVVENGNWGFNGTDFCYQQYDMTETWKQTLRSGSFGYDYSVSVDLKEINGSGGTSAAGVVFRRQTNGDCYWLDLANVAGKKLLRLYRFQGGVWNPLAIDDLGTSFDLRVKHSLKITVYGNQMDVRIDGLTHSLDSTMTYHKDPSEGANRQDEAFKSGTVGLCSFGGNHQFDNFRVQNEFLFGERDLMDSIDQFFEEFSADPNYRADPTRVYLSGFSVGGTGVWTAGLHYPDRFSALHPSTGQTDLHEGYEWLDVQRPDQVFDPNGTPPRYYKEQDWQFNETTEALFGGKPGSSVDLDNQMNENSARYILENGLNTPVRIEHPEYDTIVTNTTKPVYNWWESMDGLINVTQNATSDYAHSQYVWNKWLTVPGLTKCRQETALYGVNGEDPSDPNNIWDSGRYDQYYLGGGHGACYNDWLWADRHILFFKRSITNYGAAHTDPEEVAYKTYDDIRERAWWLTVDIADPNNNHPGLARVRKDLTNNAAEVHAKNVGTATLDLKRMGLKTGSGQTLRLRVDNSTVQSEPLVDAYKVTAIKLVNDWDTAASYSVTVNGVPSVYSLAPTSMTISNVRTEPASDVVITVPSLQDNLLLNPGFESGTGSWTALPSSDQAKFEINNQKAYAHSGSYSARIKDAKVTSQPHTASWASGRANVIPGKSYTAGAAVKTRSLRSVTRVMVNGKYSTDLNYNARACIALQWLDAGGAVISETNSGGIFNTNDWTPMEVTATSPSNAVYARVALKVISPDAAGSLGSAWFDDASLRRGYKVSGAIPVVTSITPNSGSNDGTVSITEIAGSGFVSGTPGSTVRLRKAGQSDIAGTNVVVSTNKISCKFNLAGAATGQWDVEVTNPNAERYTLPGCFIVRPPGPPLSVSSIAPNFGEVSAVVQVTDLIGNGFLGSLAVRLEKSGTSPINATNVVVVSSTKATCSINLAGAQAGVYDVVVSDSYGQVARLSSGFTVNSPPACGTGGASGVLMLGLAVGFLAVSRLRRAKRI